LISSGPIDEHTIQTGIADVAGKGVPAALLMSAAAAAVQLEANEKPDMPAASPGAASMMATIPLSCFQRRLLMLFL
jgi:hypothetical protein